MATNAVKFAGQIVWMGKSTQSQGKCCPYFSYSYIAAEAPESCALSKEAAIQIAKDYVLACFPDESASHLSELGWAAYYNRAHEYGNWGMTWQIVCYGSTENQWILPNPYVYTSDSEMPYLNFREYMDSSFELLDGLSEIQQHRIYLNTGREDISDLHIHYVLTVVINRSTHQVFFKGNLQQ